MLQSCQSVAKEQVPTACPRCVGRKNVARVDAFLSIREPDDVTRAFFWREHIALCACLEEPHKWRRLLRLQLPAAAAPAAHDAANGREHMLRYGLHAGRVCSQSAQGEDG